MKLHNSRQANSIEASSYLSFFRTREINFGITIVHISKISGALSNSKTSDKKFADEQHTERSE